MENKFKKSKSNKASRGRAGQRERGIRGRREGQSRALFKEDIRYPREADEMRETESVEAGLMCSVLWGV